MRELDKSEIEMLWELYAPVGVTRSQFLTRADHKMGDVPLAMLTAVWAAFERALDMTLPLED